MGGQELSVTLGHELLDLGAEVAHQVLGLGLLGLGLLELLLLLGLQGLQLALLALELGLLGLKRALLALELCLQVLDLGDHGLVGGTDLVEVVDVARELLKGRGGEQDVQHGGAAGLVGGAHALAQLLLLCLDLGLLGVNLGLLLLDLGLLGVNLRGEVSHLGLGLAQLVRDGRVLLANLVKL